MLTVRIKALTRKAGLTTQLQDLQNQHAALQAEEEKLVRDPRYGLL